MKGKRFKRVTALLSTAAMLLTYADFSAVDFSVHAEGDETPQLTDFDLNGDGDYDDDGEKDWGYALDSADDLYWFADKVNSGDTTISAVLKADITVNSGVLNENGELNTGVDFDVWTPIGNISNQYRGTFDGAGYTISGLYFNNNQDYVGLFGYVDTGRIRNVGVIDSYFCGKEYVGGVCGIKASTIENCYNTGVVKGSSDVGGICGENYDGTISNCYNTGDVTATNTDAFVGGICGENYGTIENCYNTGDVTGSDNFIGAVCGYYGDHTISNCYFLNTAAGDSYAEAKSAEQFASGEVCWLLNGGQSESPVFYQNLGTDESPVPDSTHHAVKYSETSYFNEHTDFDENGFCTSCGNSYQPATDSDGDGVYEISNAGQLYWFADKVNNEDASINAVLTDDITVNSGVLDEDGELNEGDFIEWTPIGAYNEIKEEYYYYSGTFDGADHTISGLYFNDSSAYNVGLFGEAVSGSVIKNVTVADSYFCGIACVGGVCGSNIGGSISDCYNKGTVEGRSSVGGVCGYKESGTIENCYNTGAVEGTSMVGGVCGYKENGTIENCYNTGAVTLTGDYAYIGGICGLSSDGTISNCYNTGDVTATGEYAYVGGVCGENYSTISNCYNTGDVTATGEDAYVGGVCGENYSTISNCYNTGDVTATGDHAYIGGVCGHYEDGGISNCYYLADTDDENGGKTASQFASSEVCWLLNGGETQAETPAFYQTLGEDDLPVFDSTHHAVKHSETSYYNEHTDFDENGFCTVCGNGYQPATTVKDVYDIDGDGETSDDVYEISNAGQLYWFAGLVNGTLGGVKRISSANAVLTADITVNSGVLDENGELNEGDFRVWTPIGYYDYVNKKSYSYCGAFDGAGHTISGLYFNDSSKTNVGLFGFVSNGESENKIMNLTVSDSYFCGDEKVGGVCGLNKLVTIQNCSNTGTVRGNSYVGGVCGYISKRVIENCYNTGKVSGNSYIGGICGYNDDKNTIQNCYNTGAVSGDTIVGGICGKVNYTSLTSNAYKMVTNCYNTGKVTGNTYVGSINGSGESKLIENCYYLETEGVRGRGTGDDMAGSTEVKSAEQFESGEVCYLLNGSETQAEPLVFYQNLGEDDSPVLDIAHKTVYFSSSCVPYSNTENKAHSFDSDKKDATCTEDGYSEYWYCKDCGKCFSDEACADSDIITDITAWKSENSIPATGHSYKDGICENCGAFEDGMGARLAGASLSLDGSIGVNFYMQLSENVVADETAYMLFTLPNGETSEIKVSDAERTELNGVEYYVFKCNVAATEMTDTITAQIKTSSGNGTQYSYSVKEYADYLLAHTEENAKYANAEELVRAMLNYGAYAQKFKEYSTDSLPCEIADVFNYEIREHSYSAYAGAKVKFAGANLSMLSNTTLRLFFKADDITDVKFMYGAEELEIGKNNGLYFVEIENISPDKLSNDFTVTVSDGGMVTYSPMTYCYQVSQTSNDAALVNLVKAIARYNDAAESYFKEAKE